ncbi:AAA-like domain protein [compost metagenome]
MTEKSIPINSMPLSKQVLLNFRAHGKEIDITFGEATTSIAAIGGTGSGKSTTIMMPALYKFIQKECPGLVIDSKNEMTAFCQEYVSRDKLLLVGGSNQCTPVNILEGISEETFRAFIGELSIIKDGNQTFWGSGAVRDSMLVFKFFKEAKNRTVTLAELYDIINEPLSFILELVKWLKTQDKISESLSTTIRAVNSCAFGMMALYDFDIVDYFVMKSRDLPDKRMDDSRVSEQYSWHSQRLLNNIRQFSTCELLRKNLSSHSEKPIRFDEEIYENNKIIAMDMPTAIYGQTAFVLGKLLRDRFYQAVLSIPESKRKSLGFGTDKFTFMLVDEYQNVMRIQSESASSGIIDDNIWFAQCRGFGHINVVSFQGFSSLYAVANNKDCVNSLLQNIISKLILANSDIETLNYLRYLMDNGIDKVRHLATPSKMGEMVIHKSGWGNACLEFTQTANSKYEHMNMFLGKDINKISTYDELKTLIKNIFYWAPKVKKEDEDGTIGDTPVVDSKLAGIIGILVEENKEPDQDTIKLLTLVSDQGEVAPDEFYFDSKPDEIAPETKTNKE